jgi:hypothetical protein
VLGREGDCRLYAHRPLTCRMSGVPVVDLSGTPVFPEGCAKCTLKPADAPRLDCDRLSRQERKILKARYPGASGVTLFIAQAVAKESPQEPVNWSLGEPVQKKEGPFPGPLLGDFVFRYSRNDRSIHAIFSCFSIRPVRKSAVPASP